MHIRPATLADVSRIVAMLADDPLGAQREDARTPLPPVYTDAFAAIETDPNHALVVVEADGDVIGTLQLSFLRYLTYRGGLRAQIEAVRVASNRRGEGIGAQLFAWAIAEARRRGAHVVQLTTDKARPDARRFYEELGFVASHEGMKLHL